MRAADEAAPRNQPAADLLAEFGMEMSGDFGSVRPWLCFMPQDDAIDAQFFVNDTTPIGGDPRIVVTDNPAPIMACGQASQHAGCRGFQALLTTIVMEIVTQAINRLGTEFPRKAGEFLERCSAVIRGQELPSHRIAGRLFEMQVGDKQCRMRWPEQCRLACEDEFASTE